MSALPCSRFAILVLATATLSALGLMEACSRSAADGRQSGFSPEPADVPPAVRPAIPRPNPAHLPPLAPDLPLDLAVSTGSRADLQHAADLFSWDTFVALNWPVRTDGEPDRRQSPGQSGDNSTVWEAWPETAEIFLPGGQAPSPWGTPPPATARPAELRELPPGTRILSQTQKALLNLVSPDSHAGPLVDQNGRYIRLETRVNRPVFETILTQRLYQREGQQTAGPIAFPASSDAAQPSSGCGAIRVQATWKILSPAEIAAGRFHAVEAVIHTPAPAPQTGAGVLERATVGLVGLHLARKTASSPEWIWSTFEHVDNCPTAGEPADRAAYNFYNKTTPDAPANLPPSPPWDPTATEPPSRRSQLIRQVPIPIATRTTSAVYQAALRAINPSSVWQYYELVGTQRRTRPTDPSPTPDRLGNTTLETYLAAAATPAATCLDCHAKARTATQAPADFSFLLRLAP